MLKCLGYLLESILIRYFFYFRYTGPGAVPERYGPLPNMESSLQVPRRMETRHMSLAYDIGAHGKLKIKHPMLFPGSQGVFMPSYMPIGPLILYYYVLQKTRKAHRVEAVETSITSASHVQC